MNNAECFLSRSTACYREMLYLYQRIKRDIARGAPVAAINRLLERLKDLDFRARNSDAAYEAEAAKTGPLEKDNPYLLDWQDVVSRVADENARMRKYLHSAMAAVKHETDSLGAAKKALGGYRGPGASVSTGRRINIKSG